MSMTLSMRDKCWNCIFNGMYAFGMHVFKLKYFCVLPNVYEFYRSYENELVNITVYENVLLNIAF